MGVNRLCGHEARSGAPRPLPGARGVIGVSGWEDRGSIRAERRRRQRLSAPGLRHGAGCASASRRCGGGSSCGRCAHGWAAGPGRKIPRSWPRLSSSHSRAAGTKPSRHGPVEIWPTPNGSRHPLRVPRHCKGISTPCARTDMGQTRVCLAAFFSPCDKGEAGVLRRIVSHSEAGGFACTS
ncbi:MAG: hypothetical protein K0R39_1501 [Symbiobacteriaceae bacterium]|nr:hypothetical protein [Symbiobacteriaceae bacterium]